jgi:hypothetical protein
MSVFLREQGIAPLDGYRAENITSDLSLVCVGNAISRGNPELEAVLDRKIRYCSLPELVREQFLWSARSIVVAGTHGKTTTTSLVGWLLTAAGRDPSVLVGGIAANFGGGYRLGGGREFVIEGDEYDSAFFDKTAKFLKYLPDIAIVNNIEFDHADIYPDVAAVELAFKRLAVLVPRNGRTAPAPRPSRPMPPARSRPSAPTAIRRGGPASCRSDRAARSSRCTSTARCSAPSRCRCSARTTSATRWPASRSAPRWASTARRSSRA